MIVQAPEMCQVQAKKAKSAASPPHRLFDYIKALHNLKSDAALGRLINIDPPEMSRLRNGVTRINARTILAIYDATGMPIENIRDLIK